MAIASLILALAALALAVNAVRDSRRAHRARIAIDRAQAEIGLIQQRARDLGRR